MHLRILSFTKATVPYPVALLLTGLKDMLPHLDKDMVEGLVSYCPHASDNDIAEYLSNIIGSSQHSEVISSEYLERRRVQRSASVATAHGATATSTAPSPSDASAAAAAVGGGREDVFQAYVKPRLESDLAVGSKKGAKGASRPPAEAREASAVGAGAGGGGSKSRKGKGIALADIEQGKVLLTRKGDCDCQAGKHRLVNNCLACGKIVCEQEGEGPCAFCGALVLREGSQYAGLAAPAAAPPAGDGGAATGGSGGGSAAPPLTEAEQKAVAFKDRLVEYDRTAAQRTAVIDDQSDYFQIDGNAWLSKEEKAALKQREAEEKQREEERRRRVVVTFDLIGRKVLLDVGEDGAADVAQGGMAGSMLGPAAAAGSGRGARVTPNPTLHMPRPMYVKPTPSSPPAQPGKGVSAANKKSAAPGKKSVAGGPQGAGRLQHDDPLVEALAGGAALEVEGAGGSTAAAAGGSGGSYARDDEGSWECDVDRSVSGAVRGGGRGDVGTSGRGAANHVGGRGAQGRGRDARGPPNSSAAGSSSSSGSSRVSYQQGQQGVGEGSSALVAGDGDGYAAGGSGGGLVPPVFDICQQVAPGRGAQPVQLAPSSIVQKEASRKAGNAEQQAAEEKEVLAEGMVVLRSWLSRQQQVDIVREVQRLGVGPSGFYTPRFPDGSTLSLQLMCLGQHWEANTRSYEPRRAYHDNAVPPPIPSAFSDIVKRAVAGAQKLDRELPCMDPGVCLVNFYERSGRLGMHQDKDESAATLRKGSPVISFSIGDSADFIYGLDRDASKAKRVVLQSGDVLVFGGASRLVFHGVPVVHPNTAPEWLVKATGLRPGRLNLTFREP
eukprot:jgi/Mesen1/7662/ME000400S06858